MILETVSVGPMQANCYILAADRNSRAIIIDPGAQAHKIRRLLQKSALTAGIVVNTHGHYDHIGCDDKFGVPVYVHSKDLSMLKDPRLNLSALFALSYSLGSEIRTLEEDSIIELDGIQLKVKHIPGHTPGGIALLLEKPDEKVVFTGDSLFYQGIGRSDLEGGDEALLIKNIQEKLLTLPADTHVYPGHGPSTTIGAEKKSNPFLSNSSTS